MERVKHKILLKLSMVQAYLKKVENLKDKAQIFLQNFNQKQETIFYNKKLSNKKRIYFNRVQKKLWLKFLTLHLHFNLG